MDMSIVETLAENAGSPDVVYLLLLVDTFIREYQALC